MNRNSPYHPLKCIVKCKPAGQHFYEVIAAFNVDSVAIDYARDCHKFHLNQPGWFYVVWERRGNQWINITPDDLKSEHDK